MPDSPAIKPAAGYYRGVWDVPYGQTSEGNKVLVALCDGILRSVGLAVSRDDGLPGCCQQSSVTPSPLDITRWRSQKVGIRWIQPAAAHTLREIRAR